MLPLLPASLLEMQANEGLTFDKYIYPETIERFALDEFMHIRLRTTIDHKLGTTLSRSRW